METYVNNCRITDEKIWMVANSYHCWPSCLSFLLTDRIWTWSFASMSDRVMEDFSNEVRKLQLAKAVYDAESMQCNGATRNERTHTTKFWVEGADVDTVGYGADFYRHNDTNLQAAYNKRNDTVPPEKTVLLCWNVKKDMRRLLLDGVTKAVSMSTTL